MKPYRVLTDEEWLAVAPLLPELQPRTETRGRPLTNTREVLNGVLWVMHSGSSWSMLPRRFPSYQTCHRRFKAWQRTGVLKRVLNQLFGAAGDEFHTAIVARMRNAPSDAAPARAPDGEAPAAAPAPFAATTPFAAAVPFAVPAPFTAPAPFVDSHWDPTSLHSAFAAPVPSSGLPRPLEAGPAEPERDAEPETRAD